MVHNPGSPSGRDSNVAVPSSDAMPMTETRKYNYKALLLVADLLAFVAGLLLATWVRYDLNPEHLFKPGVSPWDALLAVLPYALVVWAVVARFGGLYRLGQSPVEELLRLTRAVLVTFLILGAATFFYRGFSYSRAVVLLMIPLVLTGSLLFRAGARFLWHQVLRLEPVQGAAILVGTGPIARHLAEALSRHRSELEAKGVVSTGDGEPWDGPVPVLGDLDDLPSLLASGRYRAVIVADGHLSREAQLGIAEQCLQAGCQYQVVPDVFELMLDRVRVDVAGGLPLLGLKTSNLTGVNVLIKRVFDLVAVSVLLLLASPLMLATALGIKLSSRGPVFFSQERVGLHGRTFRFLKFRSMHIGGDDAVHREYVKKWMANREATVEADGTKTFKLTDDPRVFRFGQFIRKFSIDELPQLFNVLRGEMSLIGPRPPIPYEVEAYREWHRRRFEALPGITGLWQVSGRNRLSFDEMVKLDIEYIESWTPALDVKIALKTVGVVLSGQGAY